jgi:hypothetical protein
MNEKRHTIGTDPEFFMVDKNGKLISAIPHIKGKKHDPEELESGGTLQSDNVAIEFATPPAVDGEDFVVKVRNAFKDVYSRLGSDYDIAVIPSANFDADQLEDDEAKLFGCEPDFDAWTLSVNQPPPSAEESPFRSCGAHIHVGHAEGDGNDFLLTHEGRIQTVKMMDLVHGVISIVLDNSQPAMDRKKLYGKSGCHRPTDYGVEYRVLSNFWMKSPQLVMLMDCLTKDVLRFIREGKSEDMINEIGSDNIRSIIDDCRVEDATNLVNEYLKPKLSEDSLFYLNECTTNINNYDFKKEWMEVSK